MNKLSLYALSCFILLSSCQTREVDIIISDIDAASQINPAPSEKRQSPYPDAHSPYNIIKNSQGESVFLGAAASEVQMVQISPDGKGFTTVPTTEELNSKYNYILFTPQYVYEINKDSPSHQKIKRHYTPVAQDFVSLRDIPVDIGKPRL